MQNKEIFLEWIRNYQIIKIRRRIKAGNILAEKLFHLREFYWAKGGGICYDD
jgi:hypothetical protein